MHVGLPQAILLIWLVVPAIFCCAHDDETHKISGLSAVCDTVVTVLLLWWGGFFNG
jgi:hypothetical protein